MAARKTMLKQEPGGLSSALIDGSGLVASAAAFMVAIGLIALGSAVEYGVDAESSVDTHTNVGTTEITITDLAGSLGARYELYLALSDYADGQDLLMPQGTTPVSPLLLVGLSGIGEVKHVAMDEPSLLPGVEPVDTGGFRGRHWELYVGTDSQPDGFVAWRSNGVNTIADLSSTTYSTSFSEMADSSISEPRRSKERRTRSVARDGILDGLLAAVLLVGGTFAVRRLAVPIVPKVVVGFLFSLSILGLVAILRLAVAQQIVLAFLVLAIFGLVGQKGIRNPEPHGHWLFFFGLVFLMVSTVSRAIGFINVSPDSFRYLSGAAAMSDGRLTLALLDSKHMIAQQGMHAPSIAMGAEGFQSLGALVLLSAGVLMWWSIRDFTSNLGPWAAITVPTLTVTVFAFHPAVLRMAAYVNSHLLVGCLMLAVVYVSLQANRTTRLGNSPSVIGIMMAAIVLLRPEGILLVSVIFLASLVASKRSEDLRDHRSAWIIVGSVSCAWHLMLIMSAQGFPLAPTAFLFVSAALIVVAVFAGRLPRRWCLWIPRIVLASGWIFTAVLFGFSPEEVTFFSAIVQNVFAGRGGWGALGVIAAMMLAVVVTVQLAQPPKGNEPIALYPLAAFLPLILVVKLGDGLHAAEFSLQAFPQMLAEGGGRVGWGDSVNRMWTHVLFLVPLAFMMSVNCAKSVGLLRKAWTIVVSSAFVVGFAILSIPDDSVSRFLSWSPAVAGLALLVCLISWPDQCSDSVEVARARKSMASPGGVQDPPAPGASNDQQGLWK